MARALGVGLFKRRLYRKEVEDTRQLLFSALNPVAKVPPPPPAPPIPNLTENTTVLCIWAPIEKSL